MKLHHLKLRITEIFWGGGTAPSPDPSSTWRGIPPPRTSPPRRFPQILETPLRNAHSWMLCLEFSRCCHRISQWRQQSAEKSWATKQLDLNFLCLRRTRLAAAGMYIVMRHLVSRGKDKNTDHYTIVVVVVVAQFCKKIAQGDSSLRGKFLPNKTAIHRMTDWLATLTTRYVKELQLTNNLKCCTILPQTK